MDDFFKFSDAGCADESDSDGRWSVTVRLSNPDSWRLCMAETIESHPEILADAESPGPIEDMPWGDGCGRIVSDRFRALLEDHAPDHAQFFPVTIRYKCRKMDLPPYWMANFLHMVDCHHRELSEFTVEEDEHEPEGKRYSFDKLVIESRRVPKGVLVFRVRYYENVVIVRRRLREVLDAHGITGVQYYPVVQA